MPNHLPDLDSVDLRTRTETLDRLLCLNLCAASAYGFPKSKAIDWAERENLTASFEGVERDFLWDAEDKLRFQLQIEGMFALHWALGLETFLDWLKPVDNDFVLRLPDLKAGADSQAIRSRSHLRDAEEIAQAADLVYCLHWIIREAALSGSPQKIPLQEYVIVERRRALEWLIGPEAWYSISLDT